MRTTYSPEERKERKKQRDKEAYERNKESRLAKAKTYYEQNKDAVLNRNKNWQKSNRETVNKASNALRHKLRDTDPEAYKVMRRKHRQAYNSKPEVKAFWKARIIEKRKWVWDYKSTHPCSECNEPDPVVLQFHHVEKKAESIAAAVASHAWSLDRVRDEIDKCIVLCAHCHLRLHHAERVAMKVDEIGVTTKGHANQAK
jgi:hypothetical protein